MSETELILHAVPPDVPLVICLQFSLTKGVEEGARQLCPLLLEPLSVGGRILPCDDHNPCPPEHFCSDPPGEETPFCCPTPKQIGG